MRLMRQSGCCVRRVAGEACPESWGGLMTISGGSGPYSVHTPYSFGSAIISLGSSLTLSQACHVLGSGLYLLAWLSGLWVMLPALGGPLDFFTS